MASLFKEVRSEQNIFEAWRHVKRSALNSANEEIRGMAAEFEHAHQKHLRRLIDQLRTGKFVFDPVKGVLKDKSKRLAQGKDPRPIAIATLKNRVVQRAILQVLQPRVALNMKDIDTRYQSRRDPRLGRLALAARQDGAGFLKFLGRLEPHADHCDAGFLELQGSVPAPLYCFVKR